MDLEKINVQIIMIAQFQYIHRKNTLPKFAITICILLLVGCTQTQQSSQQSQIDSSESVIDDVNQNQVSEALTETYCEYEFSSEPANLALNVPKNSEIEINSNHLMDFTDHQISVTGAVSGDIPVTTRHSSAANTRSIRFTPSQEFSRGERITVSFHIPMDACGLEINEPYIVQFVTETEGFVPNFFDSGQRIYTGCDEHVRFDLFDYDPTEPTGVYVTNNCVSPVTGPSSLLVNNGAGYFQPSETHFLNSVNNKVSAVGDINSDGLHDLVTKYEPCNTSYADGGDTFWRSHETLSAESTLAEGFYGCSLTGWISNESDNQVTYLPKNYGWFFIEDDNPYHNDLVNRACRSIPADPCITGGHLTLVDRDGDQNLELMVGYKYPPYIQNQFYAYGRSNPSYQPTKTSQLTELETFEQAPPNVLDKASPLGEGMSYIDLAVGDLDNDGDDDVVMLTNIVHTEIQPAPWPETNSLSVFLDGNSATETYELPAKTIYSSANSGEHTAWNPKFIDLGDIDDDNDLDLLISAFGEILLMINRGNGQFLDYELVLEQSDVRFIQTQLSGLNQDQRIDRASFADLDSDGDLDIHRNGCAWLNDGFGEYPETPVTMIERLNNAPCPERAFGALEHIFADLDDDGDTDVMMSSDGIIEVWFNDLYEPDPLIPSFGVIADRQNKSDEKNGGPDFDRETSVIPELDPIEDESENKLQSGTITERKTNPHDEENKNQLKSGTISEYDRNATSDLTWDIQRIETESSPGKMINMDYQEPGFIHMMYQEGESKDIYYKKYNTASGNHSTPEEIYSHGGGEKVPGDIHVECGLFELDESRPVCGSFYHKTQGDLYRFGYIGEQEAPGNFAPPPAWDVEQIENAIGNSGEYSNILIDSAGSVHIIYYDTSDNRLMHIESSESQGSNNWTNWKDPLVIDSDPQSNVGQWAKAVITATDDIHVVYRTGTNAITHMHSANPKNGEDRDWVKSTVIDSVYTKHSLTLTLDSEGNPHIAYYQTGNKDLMYASAELNQQSKPRKWVWGVEEIDAYGDVGQAASITIDSENSLHIAYHDATNGSLKYATSYFSAAFETWSNWSTFTIDDPQNNSIVGTYTDIVVTEKDKIFIGYFDSTNGDLKIASSD
ncbi:MAG: hypothetical protein FI699_04295 [SAR202 cluster bacterium]|nr:hypothetical protein [Chloroflexota bacterium]MQG88073.1 hypothetical protein [SAR202 cluster bacterium]|tara:strand:+ start:663 stop:4034 length:3372 start_codon:yes stop_codon:yes gene_type:complete